MRKLILIISIITSLFVKGQDCGSFTINHDDANGVAPVDKTVTYGTATNVAGEIYKCWITKNLGASSQGSSVSDATEASSGWYWQFNRKQGYKHDGTTRTPNSTWITSIVEDAQWALTDDPCRLELGGGWRIPTNSEWVNVDAAGSWATWTDAYNSSLKLHAGGWLAPTNGAITNRGSNGIWHRSTQSSTTLSVWYRIYSGFAGTNGGTKMYAATLRCIKDISVKKVNTIDFPTSSKINNVQVNLTNKINGVSTK